MTNALHFRPCIAFLIIAGCCFSPMSLEAQTIRGILRERATNQTIDLGLVTLYTEAGDSVTSTLTTRLGRFELHSPDPGSFLLSAVALGHRETTVGVFELGEGGEISIEFRIGVEALPLEGIVVEASRVIRQLEQNGFMRRREAGSGYFMTPADIEESLAINTVGLFTGMLGAQVRGFDQLMFRGFMGFCAPKIYVDGLPQPESRQSLDDMVSLEAITAVEVYRRPSQVPLQYGGTGAACGVVLFWTKAAR